MLDKVLQYEQDKDDEDEKEVVSPEKKHLLKQKVLAVSKLLRTYKMLRMNNEAILHLKQLTPNNKVPFGLLSQGTTAINEAVLTFDSARAADRVNEAFPTGGDAGKAPKAGSATGAANLGLN